MSTVCRQAKARFSPARSGWRTTTRCKDARARRTTVFERLLALSNDLGLLSEEYDIEQRLLGNFPQAFSHVSLVNTARNLSHPDGPSADRREHATR